MTKSYRKLFFIAITQIFLAGCGFTTYDIYSLPAQLKQVYYQAQPPYEPFAINLKKRLEATGVRILKAPIRSAPIINISSNCSTPASSITESSTMARIYNLTYTATITISDFEYNQLVTPQTAAVSRRITLQPNEVFEATSQTTIIKQEMQQELTTKILNILSAPKTFRALKNIPHEDSN